MRKGFLGSLAVLAAGAGLTFGQPYGPMSGPGEPPPGAMPGPGPIPNAGPSAPGMYGYYSPDGHPIIMPPGMDGMIPPGSMGMGAPGGVYGGDGGDGGNGGFGSGKGILGGFIGGHGGLYGGIEYLYWVPKAHDLEFPLVTTSAPPALGVPGRASTALLCPPDDEISYDYENGFRFWLGWGVGADGMMACEVGGFWLETNTRNFRFQSNGVGVPVIALPFVDADALVQSSFIVALPGVAAGSVDITAQTRVYGAEASMTYKMYGGEDGLPGGVRALAGVRYLRIEESLAIRTRSTSLATGTIFGTADVIRTFNDFYGGQVGFRCEAGFGKWFVQGIGKGAIGYMRQRVDLAGVSTEQIGGLVNSVPGGLFNDPQALCRHRADELACIGEAGINVGCQLSSWCRVYAGYSFLYVNSVVRPTSSMTPILNPTRVPLSPTFGASPTRLIERDVMRDTEFWLHGANIGIQFGF